MKERLLAAMKKHGKQHYNYNGIDITITGKEILKVKLPKKTESD